MSLIAATKYRDNACKPMRHASGFGLIELMIALVLGTLIVGSAIGIFIANRRAYAATESIGRVQENMRAAFELMSRDIREAGGSPCDSTFNAGNMLDFPTGVPIPWWANIGQGILGVQGATSAPGTVPGTDSVQLVSATAGNYSVAPPGLTGATIHLDRAPTDIFQKDILMICDFECATVFQASGPNNLGNGASIIVHNPGAAVEPGNINTDLSCSAEPGREFNRNYQPGSIIARVSAVRWSIQENDRRIRSLFRTPIRPADIAAGIDGPAEEVAENVQNMQLEYLLRGGSQYLNADQVNALPNAWPTVVAVRIIITLEDQDTVGAVENRKLQRTLTHVVNLRNK